MKLTGAVEYVANSFRYKFLTPFWFALTDFWRNSLHWNSIPEMISKEFKNEAVSNCRFAIHYDYDYGELNIHKTTWCVYHFLNIDFTLSNRNWNTFSEILLSILDELDLHMLCSSIIHSNHSKARLHRSLLENHSKNNLVNGNKRSDVNTWCSNGGIFNKFQVCFCHVLRTFGLRIGWHSNAFYAVP